MAAGLAPRPEGDGRWTCTLETPGRRVPVYARRTPNWLVLETGSLAAPPGAERRAALHRGLLHANRDLSLARFALTETGQPVLRAELPTGNLQPAEVVAAVEALRKGIACLDALDGST